MAVLRIPRSSGFRLEVADFWLIFVWLIIIEWIIIKVSISSKLFDRFNVLRSVELDVLFDFIALIFQDISLTLKLLNVVLDFLFGCLYACHFRLELIKSRLFLVDLCLAVFFNLSAGLHIGKQLLSSLIILHELFI